MKLRFLLPLLALTSVAWADTPASLMAGYAQEAARSQPGFAPSADRGRQFFLSWRKVSEKMPACATCHTENPKASGSHAITFKTIAPLSPLANPERFSDSAKVEKWFRRNCTEVVGRECTAAEKADFIQFLTKA